MSQAVINQRSGWSEQETERLFEEARCALNDGLPIKSVFTKISKLTGRKPNSIRNYYYLKLKENSELGKTTFVPFEDTQVRELIETILIERSKGRSVRSIAFSLGDGDKKAMLRYQNKFRSVIRNNPEYVKSVMEDLKSQGKEVSDPFECKRHRSQPQRDISVILIELMNNLKKTGVDPTTFMGALNTLAQRAAYNSDEVRPINDQIDLQKIISYKKQITKELSRQTSINRELENKLHILTAINRAFLEQNGMERISSLSEYVCELKKQLDS